MALGLNIAMHGYTRLPNLAGFANGMVKQCAATFLSGPPVYIRVWQLHPSCAGGSVGNRSWSAGACRNRCWLRSDGSPTTSEKCPFGVLANDYIPWRCTSARLKILCRKTALLGQFVCKDTLPSTTNQQIEETCKQKAPQEKRSVLNGVEI